MIDILFANEWTSLIVRTSLISLVGWALVAFFRDRHPARAALIARVSLLAIVGCPLTILAGWSIDVPVISGESKTDTISLADVDQIHRSDDGLPPVGVKPDRPLDIPKRPIAQSDTANRPLPTAPIKLTDRVVAGETTTDTQPVSRRPENVAALPAKVSADPQVRIGFAGLAIRAAFFIWFLVASFLLTRIFLTLFRTAAHIRSSEPSDTALQSLADEVGSEAGIDRLVPIRISGHVTGPCTAGIFRPVVLIPEAWSSGRTKQQYRMLFAHELSHVRSHDAAWDLLASIVAAAGWPNLLLHRIAREHRLACEYRCDAAASRLVGNAATYRRQLAQWAIEIRGNNVMPALAALPMAQQSLLIQRLNWLQSNRVDRPVKPTRRLLFVAIIGMLLTSIAALRPVTATVLPEPPESVAGTEKTADNTDNIMASYRVRRDSMAMSSNQTEPDFNWQEPETVVCSVTDAEGEPVAGAIVQVSSLTDRAGQSFSFLMFDTWKTNERGEISLVLPDGSSEFRVAVKAENFAHFRDEFRTAEKITVQLTSGTTVRVRAIGPDERALPDAFPMVEDSNILGREFVKQQDGTHQSPTLNPDRRLMRVVDGSDAGQPILFSDVIDIYDYMAIDEDGTYDVTLQPGTRLEGQLSDDVPRPIKNGFVHAAVREGDDHKIAGFNQSGLVWHEYTTINEDGTFVFESLPRNAHAQIFAICEGWQSSDPSRDELMAYNQQYNIVTEEKINELVRRYNSRPQLIHLDHSQNPVQMNVPCRQSAMLDLRVVDPQGQPLPNAAGSMSPNLIFFGDLVIPGYEFWTDKLVRDDGVVRMAGVMDPFQKFTTESFLDPVADADGVVHFRNLPNLSDSFEVEAEGYVMAAYPTTEPEDPGRYGLVKNLVPGKLSRMTITMERERNLAARELMILDEDGSPLADITVTVISLATSVDEPDWQQWSVSRFGETSKGTTDSDGLLRLLIPDELEGQQVEQLWLRLKGRLPDNGFVGDQLAVPAGEDGNVIRIAASERDEATGATYSAKATYVNLNQQ